MPLRHLPLQQSLFRLHAARFGAHEGASQSGSTPSHPGEQQPSAPLSQPTGTLSHPLRESQKSAVQLSPSLQDTLW